MRIDPKRSAVLALDFQMDNIAATPGVAEAKVHPERAVAELDRAVDLGLRGVGIGSNVGGQPIDHARLWPV